jgi:hypothetical protein
METAMPLFLIERQFPDVVQLDAAGVRGIKEINAESGVGWLYSFLSANRKKTFCLYEASSAEAIREAARKAGLPADTVIELGDTIRPEQFA